MSNVDSEISYAAHELPTEPLFLRQHVDEYYRERVEKTWDGGHIMHGRVPDGNSILLVSNDYLDISGHPEIARAQIDCLERERSSVIMSAVFLHGDSPQTALEGRMARLVQMEDAIICQSGYAANVGLLQSIAGPDSVIYIDMLAHTSLWEGVRSAGARAVPFRHNSAGHLEHQVRRNGAGIIVVDSVYSTSGSVAPLADIIGVAERYDCVAVVDESHSLGTHGKHGEGMVASLGLAHRVHFLTASLAKAFAGRAGLIACSRRLSEFITYNSFPAIFSSALLPQEIAGLDATLDVILEAHQRRVRLHQNTVNLRSRLDQLGYNMDASQAQIVALEAGPERQTIVLRDALESRGVFGSVFCAPATAKNRSLIRLSINAGLTNEQIDWVVEVCRDIREEVEFAAWPSTRRKKNKGRADAWAHAA